jgi:hypothetical protein
VAIQSADGLSTNSTNSIPMLFLVCLDLKGVVEIEQAEREGPQNDNSGGISSFVEHSSLLPSLQSEGTLALQDAWHTHQHRTAGKEQKQVDGYIPFQQDIYSNSSKNSSVRDTNLYLLSEAVISSCSSCEYFLPGVAG